MGIYNDSKLSVRFLCKAGTIISVALSRFALNIKTFAHCARCSVSSSKRTAIDTTSLSFKNIGTKSLHGNLLEGVAVRAPRAIHGGKPTIIADFMSTHIFHFHNVFDHSFTLNALLKVIQRSQGAPW